MLAALVADLSLAQETIAANGTPADR